MFLMWVGSEFQAAGPATANEPSAKCALEWGWEINLGPADCRSCAFNECAVEPQTQHEIGAQAKTEYLCGEERQTYRSRRDKCAAFHVGSHLTPVHVGTQTSTRLCHPDNTVKRPSPLQHIMADCLLKQTMSQYLEQNQHNPSTFSRNPLLTCRSIYCIFYITNSRTT